MGVHDMGMDIDKEGKVKKVFNQSDSHLKLDIGKDGTVLSVEAQKAVEDAVKPLEKALLKDRDNR